MEKQQIVHIAVECIALITLLTYVNRLNKNLSKSVSLTNEKCLELEARCNDNETKINQILGLLSTPPVAAYATAAASSARDTIVDEDPQKALEQQYMKYRQAAAEADAAAEKFEQMKKAFIEKHSNREEDEEFNKVDLDDEINKELERVRKMQQEDQPSPSPRPSSSPKASPRSPRSPRSPTRISVVSNESFERDGLEVLEDDIEERIAESRESPISQTGGTVEFVDIPFSRNSSRKTSKF